MLVSTVTTETVLQGVGRRWKPTSDDDAERLNDLILYRKRKEPHFPGQEIVSLTEVYVSIPDGYSYNMSAQLVVESWVAE